MQKKKIFYFFLIFFLFGLRLVNAIYIQTGVEFGINNTYLYNITTWNISNFTNLNVNTTKISITNNDYTDVFTENLGLVYQNSTIILLNISSSNDFIVFQKFFNKSTLNITILNTTGKIRANLTNLTICYNSSSNYTTSNFTLYIPALDDLCNYGIFNQTGYNQTIVKYQFPRALTDFDFCSYIVISLDNTTNSTQNYCFNLSEDQSVSTGNIGTIIISGGLLIIERRKKWQSVTTS